MPKAAVLPAHMAGLSHYCHVFVVPEPPRSAQARPLRSPDEHSVFECVLSLWPAGRMAPVALPAPIPGKMRVQTVRYPRRVILSISMRLAAACTVLNTRAPHRSIVAPASFCSWIQHPGVQGDRLPDVSSAVLEEVSKIEVDFEMQMRDKLTIQTR